MERRAIGIAVAAVFRGAEVQGSRTIAGLTIQLPEEPAGLTIEPSECHVSLEGPAAVLAALDAAGVAAKLHGTFGPDTSIETAQWVPCGGSPGEGPFVQLTLDHERATDIRVTAVDPARFLVTTRPRSAPSEPVPTGEEPQGQDTTVGSPESSEG